MALIDYLLNPWIIFAVFSIIVIIFVILLSLYELKLRKKLKRSISKETDKNQKRIELLKNNLMGPEARLEMINVTSRQIFNELYGLSKDLEYSGYIREFHKQKEKMAEEFCKYMIKTIYEGEDVTHARLDTLVKILEKLLEKEKTRILEKAYRKKKKEMEENSPKIEIPETRNNRLERENILLNAVRFKKERPRPREIKKPSENSTKPKDFKPELIELEDETKIVGIEEKMEKKSDDKEISIDDKEKFKEMLKNHNRLKKF